MEEKDKALVDFVLIFAIKTIHVVE
jgi:hypothetical protein